MEDGIYKGGRELKVNSQGFLVKDLRDLDEKQNPCTHARDDDADILQQQRYTTGTGGVVLFSPRRAYLFSSCVRALLQDVMQVRPCDNPTNTQRRLESLQKRLLALSEYEPELAGLQTLAEASKNAMPANGDPEVKLKEAAEALGYKIKAGKDIPEEMFSYWLKYTGADAETLKSRAFQASQGIVLESEKIAAEKQQLLPKLKARVTAGDTIEPDVIIRSARKLGLTPSALRDQLDYHDREAEDAFLGVFS